MCDLDFGAEPSSSCTFHGFNTSPLLASYTYCRLVMSNRLNHTHVQAGNSSGSGRLTQSSRDNRTTHVQGNSSSGGERPTQYSRDNSTHVHSSSSSSRPTHYSSTTAPKPIDTYTDFAIYISQRKCPKCNAAFISSSSQVEALVQSWLTNKGILHQLASHIPC